MHPISATVRVAAEMMDEGCTCCTVETLLPRVMGYVDSHLSGHELRPQIRAAADRFLGTVPRRPGFYSLTLD